MDNKEKELTPPIICGHCDNKAPMEIIYRYSQVEPEYVEKFQQDLNLGDVYELLLCLSCGNISLRKYWWYEFFQPDEIKAEELYPTVQNFPVGLPASIQKAYQAAIKVKNIDANAFGVLIGRVLEMVCIDREAAGKFLGDKLSNLASKGEIPDKLVDVAMNLKDLRNIGAHAILGELTVNEIPILDDLCKAILEYVYTAPYLAKKAEEKLKKLKKS